MVLEPGGSGFHRNFWSVLEKMTGNLMDIFGDGPEIYTPHLPVPYILVFETKGLIYWQLGAWFQICRELEDQGIYVAFQKKNL